jgi:hypothetical protein
MRKLLDVEAVKLPPKDMTFPIALKIYAMYDKEKDLQYVGLTCWVSTNLDIHLKENFELYNFVKVLFLSFLD